MENKNHQTVTLIKEGDEVIMPIPKEAMESMGLKEGDWVKFTRIEDGAIEMTKWDGQLELFDNVDRWVSRVTNLKEENNG